MTELKNKDEQYNSLLKYRQDEEREDKNAVITLRLIVLTFIILSITGVILFLIKNAANFTAVFGTMADKKISNVQIKEKPVVAQSKFNFKMLNRYQNILLLGVDSNGPQTMPFSGVRSDTMIILNIDLQGKSVNAISIPRDSKVYLADSHGIQKINAAYALGGIGLTKKTIEETFGIRIHNYIIVNAEGVRKLIDALGGVPIYVDQNLRYHDYTGKLHIDLQKGHHVLNGKDAEGYLRFRKDYLGDIGRVHRQQKFIKALMEKLKSPEAIKSIPEALKIANSYTRTDLNLYQLSQYAALAREIDLSKVEFVMLPGAPNKKGIVSYWILDPEKVQAVINRLIYRQKSELKRKDITVGVMYSRSKEIEAAAIKDELKTLGYDVNCTGRSNQISESQIIGYNSQISSDIIKTMKNEVPDIAEFDFVHLPVRNFCTSSDMVITIKEDNLN